MAGDVASQARVHVCSTIFRYPRFYPKGQMATIATCRNGDEGKLISHSLRKETQSNLSMHPSLWLGIDVCGSEPPFLRCKGQLSHLPLEMKTSLVILLYD